jgi:membrane protein
MDRIKALVERAKQAFGRARERSAVVDVAAGTIKRFGDDDGGFYAAGLTYYTFFSVFPLLLFAGSVIGYLTLGNQKLRDELIGRGVDAVPLIRDALTPEGLDILSENRGGFALAAFVLAVYSGTGAITALQHALNKFHGITEEPNWLFKRLRALRFLVLLGGGIVASLLLTTAGNFAADLFGGNRYVGGTITFLAGVAVSIFIFATTYRYLPAHRQSWRDVLPGALVGAAAFEIMKIGGTYYLAQGESTRNDTFGTFVVAATLLVAAYLVSQVTLLAAEVNLAIRDRRNRRESGQGNHREEA